MPTNCYLEIKENNFTYTILRHKLNLLCFLIVLMPNGFLNLKSLSLKTDKICVFGILLNILIKLLSTILKEMLKKFREQMIVQKSLSMMEIAMNHIL